MPNKTIGTLPLLGAADIEGADRVLGWDASANDGAGQAVGISLDALKAGAAGLLYSSGDWLPVVAPGENTYARRLGRWARIGDVVALWFDIELATKDPASVGAVSITGLPVPARSGLTYYGVVSAGLRSFPAGAARMGGLIAPGTASITVLRPGLSGAPLSAEYDLDGASRLRGTFIYEA